MIRRDADDGFYYESEEYETLTEPELVAIMSVILELNRAESTAVGTIPVSTMLWKLLQSYNHANIQATRWEEIAEERRYQGEQKLAGERKSHEYTKSLLKEALENGGVVTRKPESPYVLLTEEEAENLERPWSVEEIAREINANW